MFETLRRHTDGTSLLRPLETSSRRSNKMSRRRTTETSLGVSFETYLRRRWDVQRDVAATSPRRLNAGWDVLHHTYSEPCLLLKIQAYSGIFTSYSDIFSHIVAYLDPCVILAYSEPCYIQDPGIFTTQDIIRTMSRHILENSVGSVTLAFWKTCFIQHFAIFRILALRNSRHIQNPVYLGTFRHIQTYSIMITLTFFLHFFSYFSKGFKKTYAFWLQWRQFQCSMEST